MRELCAELRRASESDERADAAITLLLELAGLMYRSSLLDEAGLKHSGGLLLN